MTPEPKNVLLGFHLTMCVVGLAFNIRWRHYARYLRLVFPRSTQSPQKMAVRVFFGFWLVVSTGQLVDAVISTNYSIGDMGYAGMYAAAMIAIFFALDAIVSRVGW